MTTLVDELLGFNSSILLEADGEDTDSPDNNKDELDTKKDKKDIKDDAENTDSPDKDKPDDTDTEITDEDPPTDSTDDTDPPTDSTDDSPDDNDLNKSVSSVVNNMDWEKKLYITNNFQEIYSAFNNLNKFITQVILKINTSANLEYILKSILTKVTFNITHLQEILEGNLLIDLDYKDLDKLLDIFTKDIDNINAQLNLFSKNIENKVKK